ncbi:MAG: VWA domain-containing protein, partial [Pseudomonadota bacterium]
RSFDVDQQGSAVAVVTPFDEELAKLSATLDSTRLFFGDKSTRDANQAKVEASDKLRAVAAPSVQARRAEFNLTVSGQRNLLGENELVSAVEEGSVSLDDLPEEHLPAALQDVSEDERQETLDGLIRQRRDIVKQMQSLSEERTAYINEELKKKEDLDESLDYRLYSTVKEQAAEKGLEYKSGPAY